MRYEWCVTPIHIRSTQGPKALEIEICRRNILPAPAILPSNPEGPPKATTFVDAMDIYLDDMNLSPSRLSSLSPSKQYQVPHILISIAMEENQPDFDRKKVARWLERTPFIGKWANIEAMFPSYSALLLLSVPLPIWYMLPDHPACSFVGYVTAPNLVAAVSRSRVRKSTELDAPR